MVSRTVSNYEIMRDNAAAAFLRFDQAAMIEKFALANDPAYLYIRFVDRDHRIDRKTGAVTWSEDGFHTAHMADYNAAMTIYDLLCDAKPLCHLSGQWVNVASLSAIQGGTLAKSGDLFLISAADFTGQTAALDRACRALHGVPLEKGDVAYQLQLFPFLPVILRFWDADEDFSASLQVLLDKNTLDFIHYETLMFALSHLMQRLRQLGCGGECA